MCNQSFSTTTHSGVYCATEEQFCINCINSVFMVYQGCSNKHSLHVPAGGCRVCTFIYTAADMHTSPSAPSVPI